MRKDFPSRGVDARRNEWLKARYGITLTDWNEMFESQQGCCAICGKHQSEVKKRFHTDHNHETGEVRALLCHGCNTAIGLLEENETTIINALEYLRSFKR